jgi:hypothetical protein
LLLALQLLQVVVAVVVVLQRLVVVHPQLSWQRPHPVQCHALAQHHHSLEALRH